MSVLFSIQFILYKKHRGGPQYFPRLSYYDKNTEEAVWGPQYCPRLSYRCRSQYDCQKVYWGLSTASEVFLIFATQLYQYFSFISLFELLYSDEPEVFLPKYSQTAILNAAHFQRVVNVQVCSFICRLKI